jgi:hypothetical protein
LRQVYTTVEEIVTEWETQIETQIRTTVCAHSSSFFASK